MRETGQSLAPQGRGSPAPVMSRARPGAERLSFPFWHSIVPPPPGPSPEGAVAELGVVPAQTLPSGREGGEGPGSRVSTDFMSQQGPQPEGQGASMCHIFFPWVKRMFEKSKPG